MIVNLHIVWQYTLELITLSLELIGVLIIFLGIIIWIFRACFQYFCKKDLKYVYTHIRQEIAYAILLGLEILIAVDIIKSIDTSLTFESVGVLGIIVIIRTILSFSLEYEIHGRFPWQKPIKNLENN